MNRASLKSLFISAALLAVAACSPIKDPNQQQMVGKQSASDYYRSYNYQQVSGNQYKYLSVTDFTTDTIFPDKKISVDMAIFLYNNGTYDVVFYDLHRCAAKPGIIFNANPVQESGNYTVKGQTLVIGDLAIANPSESDSKLDLQFRRNLGGRASLRGKTVTLNYSAQSKSLQDLRMQNYPLTQYSDHACQ